METNNNSLYLVNEVCEFEGIKGIDLKIREFVVG